MDVVCLAAMDYETVFFNGLARFRITQRRKMDIGRMTNIEIPKPLAMAKAGEGSTLGACRL